MNTVKNDSVNLLTLLSNATGAEYEDQALALSIVEETLLKRNSFDNMIEKVKGWAAVKGFLNPENSAKQFMKIIEEIGEIAKADIKSDKIELKDGIGDAFVTIILYAYMKGFHPTECLEHAWNEIKDRTGKVVDGSFIKNIEVEHEVVIPIDKDLHFIQSVSCAVLIKIFQLELDFDFNDDSFQELESKWFEMTEMERQHLKNLYYQDYVKNCKWNRVKPLF